MAKVLFIGDPHLKITRFEQATKFLTWLNTTISIIKPDLVVNLGDTFDTHAVLRSEIITEFMKHVRCTLQLNIPYVYLVGNHDMYKPNDAKYHALLPFKGAMDNFFVVDSTTDLFDMTFVPYQHAQSNFPSKTIPICVAHQTFKGADYGDITTQDGVDADSVAADIIISGHIHKRQSLGPKVVYPGSPFSQSVNDVDQIKGLLLFDTESYQQQFVPCPMPMWRMVKLDMEIGADDIKTILEKELNSTDHWVVQISGPKPEIVGLINSTAYKNLIKGKDVKFKPIFTDKEKRKAQIEALSMEHIISEYVAKVYDGNLDRNIVKDTALDILKKTRSKSF